MIPYSKESTTFVSTTTNTPPSPPPPSPSPSPSSLPPELLSMIAAKLTDILDYVSFRGVCTPWRSAAGPTTSPKQLPWLLLPYNPASPIRCFFSLSTGKTYGSVCPDLTGKTVCGSSFGWIALIAADSSLSLWNPITRAEIALPPPTGLPAYAGPRAPRVAAYYDVDGIDVHCFPLSLHYINPGYPWKVTLTSSPAQTGCTVLVVLASSTEFASCKIGDDAWTIRPTGLPRDLSFLVPCGSRLYAVDSDGEGVAFDANGAATRVQAREGYISFVRLLGFYMAEAGGELYMVHNYVWADESDEEEQCVDVHKLECVEGEYEWERVRSVGDLAFFLSGNHASVVRASEFPQCRKDCVYFCGRDLEDFEVQGDDVVVFKIKKEEFAVAVKVRGCSGASGSSTWVTPSLL